MPLIAVILSSTATLGRMRLGAPMPQIVPLFAIEAIILCIGFYYGFTGLLEPRWITLVSILLALFSVLWYVHMRLSILSRSQDVGLIW